MALSHLYIMTIGLNPTCDIDFVHIFSLEDWWVDWSPCISTIICLNRIYKICDTEKAKLVLDWSINNFSTKKHSCDQSFWFPEFHTMYNLM
jgi:hypothetical protein